MGKLGKVNGMGKGKERDIKRFLTKYHFNNFGILQKVISTSKLVAVSGIDFSQRHRQRSKHPELERAPTVGLGLVKSGEGWRVGGSFDIHSSRTFSHNRLREMALNTSKRRNSSASPKIQRLSIKILI